MNAKGVHPEGVFMLWVTDADMAGHSFDVAMPGKVAESSRHVLELPLACFCVSRELRDALSPESVLMRFGLNEKLEYGAHGESGLS